LKANLEKVNPKKELGTFREGANSLTIAVTHSAIARLPRTPRPLACSAPNLLRLRGEANPRFVATGFPHFVSICSLNAQCQTQENWCQQCMPACRIRTGTETIFDFSLIEAAG
jgi:hypothetical protein